MLVPIVATLGVVSPRPSLRPLMRRDGIRASRPKHAGDSLAGHDVHYYARVRVAVRDKAQGLQPLGFGQFHATFNRAIVSKCFWA